MLCPTVSMGSTPAAQERREKAALKIAIASGIILILGIVLAATARQSNVPTVLPQVFIGISTPFFTMSLMAYLWIHHSKEPAPATSTSHQPRRSIFSCRHRAQQSTSRRHADFQIFKNILLRADAKIIDLSNELTEADFGGAKVIKSRDRLAILKDHQILQIMDGDPVVVTLFKDGQLHTIENPTTTHPEIKPFLDYAKKR